VLTERLAISEVGAAGAIFAYVNDEVL